MVRDADLKSEGTLALGDCVLHARGLKDVRLDEVLPAPVQAQFLADLMMLQVLTTQANRPR